MFESQLFAIVGTDGVTRTYRFNTEQDDDRDAPWMRSDGHGVVSDWTSRDKRPSECILSNDGSGKRFYDIAESTRIAKRDSWGLSKNETDALTKKLGRTPTPGEVTARAVELDFDFLRGWCNDDWTYEGVIVTFIPEGVDENDVPNSYDMALWGIESNADDYKDEVAFDLANEHSRNEAKEQAESAYWNERDTVTK